MVRLQACRASLLRLFNELGKQFEHQIRGPGAVLLLECSSATNYHGAHANPF